MNKKGRQDVWRDTDKDLNRQVDKQTNRKKLLFTFLRDCWNRF